MMTTSSPLTTGFVVSTIVKVAVVEVLLPQSSVAVKVTVASPVAAQRSLNAAKLLLHVTPLQMSDAAAPPLEVNQALSSA